jgi:hypothetical protein
MEEEIIKYCRNDIPYLKIAEKSIISCGNTIFRRIRVILIKLQGKMLSTGDNKTIAPRSRF